MLTTHKRLQPSPESHFIARHLDTDSPMVFFDIETTGFHRDYSKLVSISMIEMFEDDLHYHYFFNNSGKEEAELLTAAQGLLSSKYLISFNGDAFDVPYLMHKYAKHGINTPLTTARNIDLMKVARASLHLDSYKLKSIETALGIHRTDTLSGLDCIEAYKQHLETGDPVHSEKIALHNEEDTLNLIQLMYRLLEHHSGVLELYKPHYFEWRSAEINLISLKIEGDFATLIFEPDLNIEETHWYDDRGHIFKTNHSGSVARLEITLPVQHHNIDGFDLSTGIYLKGQPRQRVISIDGHPLYENIPIILQQLDQWMGISYKQLL